MSDRGRTRRPCAVPGVLLAACVLLGCSRTVDAFVGSDVPPASEDDSTDDVIAPAAGRAEPPPISTAGGAGTEAAGTAGSREGGSSAAGAGSEAPEAGTSDVPEPEDAGGAPASELECDPGTADCDAVAGNGCEVSLLSDRLHCGRCDAACVSNDCICEDGERVLLCPTDFDDCDRELDNGCETDLSTSLSSCGSCGLACPVTGSGVSGVSCTAGACVLTCTLPTLRGDCDGDPENGCETDLFHTAEHCGECGKQCNACADARCL